MAITQAICNSFKKELFQQLHNFAAAAGDTFAIALYSGAAALGPDTTAYSPTNEIAGTGYTAGGKDLVNVEPVLVGSTAVVDFQDVSWTASTFTARGALIYNKTDGNRAVCVLDFGADRSVSNGTFTIQFPTPDAANAILRAA